MSGTLLSSFLPDLYRSCTMCSCQLLCRCFDFATGRNCLLSAISLHSLDAVMSVLQQFCMASCIGSFLVESVWEMLTQWHALELQGIYGCGAHSDYGVLTILATDANKALQINTAGEWVYVEPKPDCFIINLGDILQR